MEQKKEALKSHMSWVTEELQRQGLTNVGQLNYIVNVISNALRKVNDNCIDNFRISFNGVNEIGYKEALDEGCCGFWDEEIQLNNGKIVKFGFNYGH